MIYFEVWGVESVSECSLRTALAVETESDSDEMRILFQGSYQVDN